MFDMYHAKAYEVKEEQLRDMIDTPFNYRHQGMFTPFMSIKAPDRERTRSLLANDDGRSALLAAIDGYDAAASLKTGERWCGELRRTFEEVREEDFHAEVYKLMGHLMLIWRSRAYFMACLRNRGLPDSEDMALDEEWNAFVHAVPRSLYRRSSEEYEALLERYRKLIALERELLAAAKERLLSFEPPEIRDADGANPLGIGE